MKRNSEAGIAPVVIILILAGLTGATWAAKPSWFPGASKRAANSTAATAQLIKATDTQGAAAAASVVKIGEAAASTAPSPARDFIAAEVPVALSRLPAPDPMALLEAEKRRSAVMEGRADEARRLYEQASKESARLLAERDAAIAARKQADLAIEQAAASEHAKTVQMAAIGFIALLAVAGWWYVRVRLGGVNMAAGKFMRDLRVKHPEVAEKAEGLFDSYLNRNEQADIAKHAS